MATEKIRKQAKKLGAAARGMAGVLSTLEGEHAEVDSLMSKLLEADDVERRMSLYHLIRTKLLAHARAEASEFYPVCGEYPETQPLVADALAEHEVIERLIHELDVWAIDSSSWLETFIALRRDVRRHVEEEESVLLERCKNVMSKERLRAVDRNYRARRELLEQSLAKEGSRPAQPHLFPPVM